MKIEKACYSYSKMMKMREMAKSIDWSVKRKDEHFAKACEVMKVYEFGRDNINYFIFSPDLYHMKDYFSFSFHYKDHTKKELDSMLRNCKKYIVWEWNAIFNMMQTGEVDTKD